MYKQHFGLSLDPFGAGLAQDGGVFSGQRHRMLQANLTIALTRSDSIAVVYGAPGVGKTTAVAHAVRQMSTQLATGFIAHAPATAHELLEQLLTEFGFKPYKNSRTERLQMWRQFLNEMGITETRVFIIVENGDELPTEVLIALENLTSADASGSAGANVVLTMRESSDDLLNNPQLTTLRQRIRLQSTVVPLTVEETGEYLTFKFAAAGGDINRIVAADAVPAIFRFSGGVIRVINNIVDSCLSIAATRREAQLTADLVTRVAIGIFGIPAPELVSYEPAARESTPTSKPEPMEEPLPEPEARAEPEPVAEPQPRAEPERPAASAVSAPVESASEERPPNRTVPAEPTPAAEIGPLSTPAPDPEPATMPESTVAEIDPIREPAQPAAAAMSEPPASEPVSDPPMPEPAASEPVFDPPMPEPAAIEPEFEPVRPPEPEPAELVPPSAIEPAAELDAPVPEPAAAAPETTARGFPETVDFDEPLPEFDPADITSMLDRGAPAAEPSDAPPRATSAEPPVLTEVAESERTPSAPDLDSGDFDLAFAAESLAEFDPSDLGEDDDLGAIPELDDVVAALPDAADRIPTLDEVAKPPQASPQSNEFDMDAAMAVSASLGVDDDDMDEADRTQIEMIEAFANAQDLEDISNSMAETLFDDEELNRLAATLSVPVLENPESYQSKPIIDDEDEDGTADQGGKAEAS